MQSSGAGASVTSVIADVPIKAGAANHGGKLVVCLSSHKGVVSSSGFSLVIRHAPLVRLTSKVIIEVKRAAPVSGVGLSLHSLEVVANEQQCCGEGLSHGKDFNFNNAQTLIN